MAKRKERREIDNHFVAEINGSHRPWHFYGLTGLLTAITGMLMLAIDGALGVDLQQACYIIVILSALLQHSHLDHLQLCKLGAMPGTGERLLSGRAGAA